MDAPETTSGDQFDSGAGTENGALDKVRALVADLRDRALKEAARADAAETLLVNAETELASIKEMIERARLEAASIVEEARHEAQAIASEALAGREAATTRESGRDSELVEALRSYLSEIEEAQSTLLRIARRALTALAAVAPDADEDEAPQQRVEADLGSRASASGGGAPTSARRRAPRSQSSESKGSTAKSGSAASSARRPAPRSQTAEPEVPPLAGYSDPEAQDGHMSDHLLVAGSNGSTEAPTDEQVLTDVSNQRDLDRLDHARHAEPPEPLISPLVGEDTAGSALGRAPQTQSSEPEMAPLARSSHSDAQEGHALSHLLAPGSNGSTESTTDEHRLIDLSNQRDLDRLDARPSVRNLLRGL